MRIISGKYGGRRISPPTNMPHTRPTTDIAKEGLFSILQNNLSFKAGRNSYTIKTDLPAGTYILLLQHSGKTEQTVLIKN